MKAFRALLLVLALSASAFAGNMPFDRTGDMPNDKNGNMPCGREGDMPNGKIAAPDATTDVILTLLQSVLPLL